MSDIVPFGKYKGRSVEDLAADKQYSEWLVNQDWFRDRFARLFALLSAANTPQETPEHNQMQAQFLDDSMCLAFLRAYNGKDIVKNNEDCYVKCIREIPALIAAWNEQNVLASQELAADWEKEAEADFIKQLNEYERRGLGKDHGFYRPVKRTFIKDWFSTKPAFLSDDSEPLTISRKFEADGADVRLEFYGGHHLTVIGIEQTLGPSYLNNKVTLEIPHQLPKTIHVTHRIELKPCMGDDYPAVLRQVAASGCNVVIVRQYSAVGASFEQAQKIFKSQHVRLMLESELEEE